MVSHHVVAFDSDCGGDAAAELAQITMSASAWLTTSGSDMPAPPKCLEFGEERTICENKAGGIDIPAVDVLIEQMAVAIEMQIEKTLAKQHQELLLNVRGLLGDPLLKSPGSSSGKSAALKEHCSRVSSAPLTLREKDTDRARTSYAARNNRASTQSSPKSSPNGRRSMLAKATTSVWKDEGIDDIMVDLSSLKPQKLRRQFGSDPLSKKILKATTAVWNDEEGNDTLDEEDSMQQQDTYDPRVSPCMLSPIGKTRMLWDALWCFSLAYDMWWSMFLLVFTSEPDATLDICETLSLVTFGFWTCDIVVNCLTGYVVDGRHIVLDRRAVVLKYARSWLLFDIIAVFPWEKVADVYSGSKTLALSRAAKASKAVKLIKALKLLRAIKMLQMKKGSKFLKAHFQEGKKRFAVMGRVFILIFCFCLFSHFHGCLWAAVNPDWSSTSDATVALERYRESFWWAYTAITFGTEVHSTTIAQAVVEALLSGERLLFFGVVATVSVLKTLVHFQEHTLSSIAHNDAILYLREHDVGMNTQIEVLFSVHDTVPAMRKQQNFQSVITYLPVELKRRINTEMWSSQLLTLELLATTIQFHADVVVELAQVVKEEVYAAKAVVCREGDPAIAAYYVQHGKIEMMSSNRSTPIHPFVPGNWMGERALLRTGLNRSTTATCLQYTIVLMVPAQAFHGLLEKLDIHDRFQEFVDELKFLCGRCGKIGDHDSDTCPSLCQRLGSFESLSDMIGLAS